MTEIKLLDLITFIWKIVGWNMNKSTKLMNLMTFIIFILLIVTAILGIMVPICTEANTNTLADAFEIVGPYYQVMFKMVVTKFSIHKVSILLYTMNTSFWPTDKFGTKLKKKILLKYIFVTKIFKIFVCTAYVCSFVIMLRPWLLENSVYPLTVYNIFDVNDSKQYFFMYTWQLFNFIFGATMLLAIDGLYILFVTNIYCQLKLLKHAFRSLNLQTISSSIEEENKYEKIKEYVDHHNLILKFTKDLSNLFSLQILNQFVGNTASICMGIYIATVAGVQEISAVLKAITIILLFLSELILFCTAGTLITQASVEISDSMWFSGWELMYSKRLRYATQMIVMRSQKGIALKAGKMFDIDLTSLAAILKMSVSVYTLMNNVKNKEMK